MDYPHMVTGMLVNITKKSVPEADLVLSVD
jgi:hypothetical protein